MKVRTLVWMIIAISILSISVVAFEPRVFYFDGDCYKQGCKDASALYTTEGRCFVSSQS